LLLEHAYGGANTTDTTPDDKRVWRFLWPLLAIVSFAARENTDEDLLAALLRVMVLRSAPPADLVVHISPLPPLHSRVVEEGAQLLAGLPAYLARRRALLAEHTSLITPLRALVSGYEEPTTTEELWDTGLGTLPGIAAPSFASDEYEEAEEGWCTCCCCFWRPWDN
jgi:hypothetical protein